MEKTKLDLLTICDYASISQDNKLSIVGIFDQIFVSNLPTQHSQFYIVGVLSGTAEKMEALSLEIKDPDGKDVIPAQKLDIKIGPNGKSNVIAAIGNMPVNETGFFKIILSTKAGTIGEKEFGVFKAGSQSVVSESSKRYTN